MKFPPQITTQQIEKLPLAEFNGKIVVVSAEDANYKEAIEYLNSQKIIGFDTETKPCFAAHAPKNRVALLQLAGEERAYIFRLQMIGLPKALAELLSNVGIIKVGAAVRDDINGLNRYSKFNAGGFKDLQSIAEKFGIMEKSVRKMAAIILDVRVSKSQQLSNWESSRLTEAQLKYAAIDAWVCRQMYVKLLSIV
ncbi:MAG: 3'-5' exonuclease domain-containing protein 2 [Bacteroidales bacterium]|nr:3'-5' exonuclease domain-containing protein 2 [Bacteroidales bacterium]